MHRSIRPSNFWENQRQWLRTHVIQTKSSKCGKETPKKHIQTDENFEISLQVQAEGKIETRPL